MDGVTAWWYSVLMSGRFQLDPRYTKTTQIEVSGDFGTRMETRAFDTEQLEWGKCDWKKWQNGIYEASGRHSFVEPKAPIFGYCFYPSEDWENGGKFGGWQGPGVWHRFLQWVSDEKIYDLSDCDILEIPMPEFLPALINIGNGGCGRINSVAFILIIY